MLHEFLLEVRGDKVPHAGRYPGEDIDNLHSCSRADREIPRMGECGLVLREGVNVNKDTRERDHLFPLRSPTTLRSQRSQCPARYACRYMIQATEVADYASTQDCESAQPPGCR